MKKKVKNTLYSHNSQSCNQANFVKIKLDLIIISTIHVYGGYNHNYSQHRCQMVVNQEHDNVIMGPI